MNAQPQDNVVLFDLDGTILDSAAGIVECLAETVKVFGGPTLGAKALRSKVGPPIADTLRELTPIGDNRIPEAVAHYRDLYLARGALNSTVFPGIFALLAALRERRVTLAVATSKRESQARLMLSHHSLSWAFLTVSGAAEDESGSEKAAVIAEALRRVCESGRDVSRAILVGDRVQDMTGAATAGIPAIFAGWGYGDPAESAGAVTVADSPAAVMTWLDGAPRPPVGRKCGAGMASVA